VIAVAGHLDARSDAYVDEVLGAIAEHVPVVAAYLLGSGAVGSLDLATSDVDVEGAQPPNFELNAGGGDESECWFVLDAAVAQDHALTLRGRPWSEHFEPIPEERIRAADLEHGEWLSKPEAR
jgi:hypothetical protein